MATYSKIPLSYGSYGTPIQISVSSSPGVPIHFTSTSSGITDEIYIYATNVTSFDSLLTVFWGTTATNNMIANITIDAYAGITLVIPGLILQGTGSLSSTIYAYTTYPSAVNVVGYVNRITP